MATTELERVAFAFWRRGWRVSVDLRRHPGAKASEMLMQIAHEVIDHRGVVIKSRVGRVGVRAEDL